MRTAQGPFPMETTYTWSATTDESTRMTLRNRGEPTGFWIVAAFMARAMRHAQPQRSRITPHGARGSVIAGQRGCRRLDAAGRLHLGRFDGVGGRVRQHCCGTCAGSVRGTILAPLDGIASCGKGNTMPDRKPSGSDDAVAIVEVFGAAWADHDLDRTLAMVTEECVSVTVSSRKSSRT